MPCNQQIHKTFFWYTNLNTNPVENDSNLMYEFYSLILRNHVFLFEVSKNRQTNWKVERARHSARFYAANFFRKAKAERALEVSGTMGHIIHGEAWVGPLLFHDLRSSMLMHRSVGYRRLPIHNLAMMHRCIQLLLKINVLMSQVWNGKSESVVATFKIAWLSYIVFKLMSRC